MDKLPLIYVIIIIGVISVPFLSSSRTVCGNGVIEGRFPEPGFEECDDGNTVSGDGCSESCRMEFPEKIYVALYMGNFDGHFSEDWFFFYDQLIDLYESERIPVGASIYTLTLDNPTFHPYAKRMYESPYIEIVQKAWSGDEREQIMDTLSYEEQKEIVTNGRDDFRRHMAVILGIPEDKVKLPVAYNQPQGRFTNVTRRVLEELGFKIFFEMYMNDDLGPVESTRELDVLQYGVGLTTTGDAGSDTEFYQPWETFLELKSFDREDLNMIYINNTLVVPIWAHHMDFESRAVPNTVDQVKWEQYKYILARIKEEPNLVLISPSQIWEMRH